MMHLCELQLLCVLPICALHKWICGVDVDSCGVGLHGLSCRTSAGHHARHSALNDLVTWSLVSVEVPSRLEQSSLVSVHIRRQTTRRFDDDAMDLEAGSVHVDLDVLYFDTLAPSNFNRAVTCPGSVATFAEDDERMKYAEISQTYIFAPIVVETMGAVVEESLTSVK